MITLIALDFDDTLCLTEEACFRLENEIAGDLGFPPMSRQLHRHTWGLPLERALALRFPGMGVAAFMERLGPKMERYISLGALDAIPDENLRTLDRLRIEGRHLAVVTARKRAECRHLMAEDHPLRSRLDAFYHEEACGFSKPDPRVFDRILEDFSADPGHTVYVGDSPSDALCAKEAGIRFVACLESRVRPSAAFAGLNADGMIDRFPMLPQILCAMERTTRDRRAVRQAAPPPLIKALDISVAVFLKEPFSLSDTKAYRSRDDEVRWPPEDGRGRIFFCPKEAVAPAWGLTHRTAPNRVIRYLSRKERRCDFKKTTTYWEPPTGAILPNRACAPCAGPIAWASAKPGSPALRAGSFSIREITESSRPVPTTPPTWGSLTTH